MDCLCNRQLQDILTQQIACIPGRNRKQSVDWSDKILKRRQERVWQTWMPINDPQTCLETASAWEGCA
jgi:hypothetical protein